MIDLDELQASFDEVYKELMGNTWKYRVQAQAIWVAEQELAHLKLEAYAEGEIQGKNATEREANEFKLFEDAIVAIDEMKKEEARLYRMMEMSRIKVEYQRATLRIQEIVYHMEKGGEDGTRDLQTE